MLTFDGQTLLRDGVFIASDTPLMRRYFEWALAGFWGHVLLTGLGIGTAANYVAGLPLVHSVTVIERDAEIVSRFPVHRKVKVIVADAFKVSATVDCIHHDIWSKLADYDPSLLDRYSASVQIAMPLSYREFIKA